MSVRVATWGALAATFLAALPLAGCMNEPLPPDAVLIARFEQQRKDFDRLLLIAQAQWKRYGTIDIRSEGDTEAHRIMKQLGIRHVLGDSQHVKFFYDVFNLDSKGYEFFPVGSSRLPPQDEIIPVLDSLDYGDNLEAYPTRYRALGDGWYLFVQLQLDNGKTKADVTRNN